ncbi:MAG: FAD-binding oxidoreductase [Pseudomonadota bacterium]
MSPETACELVPTLRPETLAAAFIEEAAQDIDVDRVLQSFARTCRARGGKIVSGAEIVAARRENGLWQAETRTGERYAAPVLLNAAGAWGDQLAELAGVAPAGLQPCRRSAALIPVGGLDIAAWPMLVAVDESWYAKPDAGRLLVSPADEDPVEPHDAWPDDLVLAEGLDRFATMVDIPIPRLEHTWAGLRSFVPDRSPVAGFDADAEGFFWLVGQGGYGVQTCPALSQLAADLVLSHTPALAAETVAALSPHRLTRPAAVAS